ncbi:uncharacterized protein LOC121978375 [Zingiber officinale]|uniref:uncharacterized protein LOC121978375 n=1 Tax=Zingiber officinale TaxID=94328 RepID=UPI001C4C0948|nr:uncharacterized protein LOC121978375 [Zingiber officinale]
MGGSQITSQKELDVEKQPSLLLPNQTQNKDGEEATKKVEETFQTTTQNQAVPFPQKLIASQKDKEFNRFLKKIKEICIEVPLIDALHQMPKIGPELIPRAFCDLGSNVSILSYSLCKKLGLQNIKLTTMALQLADHSCRYPMGIVEDVPVEVGGCIVPTDFIILDIEEDPKIPITLGRPFLATAGAIIDVKSYRLCLKIGKEKIEFDLSNSSIFNSSPQGHSRKINMHKVEECNFHENSPPANNTKYICPALAKLKV